jgi:hypothetical protein
MKAVKKRIEGEAGSAFIISILVLFMLSVLGMALMLTTTTETDISVNYRFGEMAFFNAESALEYGKNILAAYALLDSDLVNVLPPARVLGTMAACPGPGVTTASRDYQYFIDDSVSGVRTCIGRIVQDLNNRAVQYDFRSPVSGDTRGDIDDDGTNDVQGTVTLWIRRPVEGNIDRVENDRAILTAEGTAPNYEAIGTGRGVSVRRLEMSIRLARASVTEDGDIYPDITKGSSISEEYAGSGAEYGGSDYGAQGTVTH